MSNSQTRHEALRKTIEILLAAIVIIAIVLAVSAAWTFFGANISGQEAMEIAIAHVGGGMAGTPDLSLGMWRWFWGVEVWYNGLIYEIYVHPNTGAVVRVEIDRWD